MSGLTVAEGFIRALRDRSLAAYDLSVCVRVCVCVCAHASVCINAGRLTLKALSLGRHKTLLGNKVEILHFKD